MQKKQKTNELESTFPTKEQIQTLEEKIHQLQAENLSLYAVALKVEQLEKKNAELSTQVKILKLEKKLTQKIVLSHFAGIKDNPLLLKLTFYVDAPSYPNFPKLSTLEIELNLNGTAYNAL